MKTPLKVLIAEDNPADAELVLRELRKADFDPQWTQVDNEPDFLAALEGDFEIILSDFRMPTFSGLRALELLRESGRDLPFIIISGTIGEETAVEAVQKGADDFLLKDRLKRLGSSVRQTLEEARLRRERNEAEMALRKSEARFRRLVDSNVQGVFFWNTKGEITDGNDAFLKMVGYDRADLEAGLLGWVAMTPPEFAERDEQALKEIEATGVCTPLEKLFRRKDGGTVSVLLGAATFEDNPEEGIAYVVDLTQRNKLEEQFLRAQRMESIGTLAGGIAHDLNNVLGPIMMSIEVLKMRFPDPESAGLLAIIASSTERGADMVRQVLSFARGVEGRRMEIQVGHLLAEVERIAVDTFSKDIVVRSSVPHDLWTVLGDPTQLHQVLLNLCVNARDAMPSGGHLTLIAENRFIDEQYAALDPGASVGPHVCLTIEDTGTGMPKEIVAKIFDPFFTTKDIGKGTGLGLSTSQGIVKSHNGFLRVYSEPGRGTRFNLYLPAQTESPTELELENEEEMPRGQGELVLVIDDESAVLEITRQTLETFGYKVLIATNGGEAATIFATKHSEIAVVLTDMMMPIMDGPATIQVLRKMKPEVRLIAASGLAANGHVAEAERLGVKHFLPKPYTAKTLLGALRAILDEG